MMSLRMEVTLSLIFSDRSSSPITCMIAIPHQRCNERHLRVMACIARLLVHIELSTARKARILATLSSYFAVRGLTCDTLFERANGCVSVRAHEEGRTCAARDS